MRLLVLGGTVFLSRAAASEALARGHEVVCVARGSSGSVPEGARLVIADRTGPLPDLGPSYDAVVEVARQPSWVARALDATPGAHWVFVSTVNVYADDATPGGRPGTLPLREPRHEDADLTEEPDAYGPMKVACERLVLERAASASVVRPGLVVGPGDPTGRFSWWPRRLARGGEVLGPGDPADVSQVIDVRDLAAWLVTLAERRQAGTWDAVGEPQPISELLAACSRGVGAEVTWTWVPQEVLQAQGVQPWAGPDAVPLWLPRPEYDGLGSHDARPALQAGLTLRPLADTARDTLAWLETDASATAVGLSPEREAEVLAAWHQEQTARS